MRELKRKKTQGEEDSWLKGSRPINFHRARVIKPTRKKYGFVTVGRSSEIVPNAPTRAASEKKDRWETHKKNLPLFQGESKGGYLGVLLLPTIKRVNKILNSTKQPVHHGMKILKFSKKGSPRQKRGLKQCYISLKKHRVRVVQKKRRDG